MDKGGFRKRCTVCRQLGHNMNYCPIRPQPTESQSSPVVGPSQSGPAGGPTQSGPIGASSQLRMSTEQVGYG